MVDSVVSLLETSIKVVQHIRNSLEARKQNATSFVTIADGIERIRLGYQDFRKNHYLSAIHDDVSRHISAELEMVQRLLEGLSQQIDNRRPFRSLLGSIEAREAIIQVKSFVTGLERHLDACRLMVKHFQIHDSRLSEIYELLRKHVIKDVPSSSSAGGVTVQEEVTVIDATSARLQGTNPSSSSSPSQTSPHSPGPTMSIQSEQLDKEEEDEIQFISSLPMAMKLIAKSDVPEDVKRTLQQKIDDFQTRWELKFDDLVFEKDRRGWVELGEGGFSRVYKAKLRQGETFLEVAVKELKVEESELEKFKPNFLREMHGLIQYRHRCILEAHGAIWARIGGTEDGIVHNPMIVLERMTCSLHKAIQKHWAAVEDMGVRKGIALDVAAALAHLHEKSVVHRDVKPENVLLRVRDGEVVRPAKLCDFGVSREVQVTKQMETYTLRSSRGAASGTVVFMPPEVLKDQRKAPTRPSWDVWSFGLLLCFLGGGETPFSELDFINAPSLAREGRLGAVAREWADSIGDEAMRTAALRCLRSKWKERCTMADVVAIISQGIPGVGNDAPSDAESAMADVVGTISQDVPELRVDTPSDAEFAMADVVGIVSRNVPGVGVDAPKDVEFANVLLDPRWMTIDTSPLDIPGWKENVNELRWACLANGLVGEEDFDAGMKLLRSAARESWPFIFRNPRELMFQMQSRLVDSSDESWLVRRYLETASKVSPTPRVRSLSRCWNIPGGRQEMEIPCADIVNSLAVTGDEGKVVAGIGNKVVLMDLESSVVIREYIGHENRVNCVAVTPDGRHVVSGSWDKTLRVWELGSGKPVGEPLRGHTYRVHCVAVTPDGRHVVSGSWDKTLRVWELGSGKAVGEPLRGHKNFVWCVAVTPDGRHVVSGSGDKTLRVWELGSGKPVGEPLRGHTNWVECVAVTPDGRHVVSGSRDETLRVWELGSGKPVGEPLRGHTDGVRCVAVTPDGRHVVSGSWDKTLRVWELGSGKPVGEPLRGHTRWVWCVAVTPDGRHVVSGSWDKTLRVWELGSGKPVGEPLRGHENRVNCVAVTPDGRHVVSGSRDETLRVWELGSGKPVGEPLRGHKNFVWCVAVTPDGRHVVSGSGDKTLRVWELGSGKPVGEPLRGHTNFVWCVAVTPDGRHVVSGSGDKTLRVWELGSGKPVGEPLRGHTNWVECVAVTPDGRHVVSGSEDKTLRVWELGSGKPVGEPKAFSSWVVSVRCFGASTVKARDEDGNERYFEVSGNGLREIEAAVGRVRESEVLRGSGSHRSGSAAEAVVRVSGRSVRLGQDGPILATLPAALAEPGTWDYNAAEGRLVVGLKSGRVLVLEVET